MMRVSAFHETFIETRVETKAQEKLHRRLPACRAKCLIEKLFAESLAGEELSSSMVLQMAWRLQYSAMPLSVKQHSIISSGYSMSIHSAGAAFRQAVRAEKPLQVVGTINANHALLAQRAGFKAIYLSGGGVAAGSLGLPDLGISTLDDVLTDVRRITDVCDLPLLVDVDTGFGPSAINIARTVKALTKAGAGAMHIEEQVGAKRCGHRPGKEIVSTSELAERVMAAADAK